MSSPGDIRPRHWVLISAPAVLCLLAWATVQFFGGYHAVRLRGFTLKRISDLGQAERMAEKCVGLDFRTARRSFNDGSSWQQLSADPQEIMMLACDWGRRPAPGAGGEVWVYKVNSSEKVLLFVEGGKVVGASGN